MEGFVFIFFVNVSTISFKLGSPPTRYTSRFTFRQVDVFSALSYNKRLGSLLALGVVDFSFGSFVKRMNEQSLVGVISKQGDVYFLKRIYELPQL